MKLMKRFILSLSLLLFSTAAHAVPPIQQARLDNGLKILLMEAHNVPMVSMQLELPAGSRFDPEGRGGTASLLAAMLTDHTARHDYVAWTALLDREAIRLGSAADRDGMSLSLTVLKEVLPGGVAALAEALLEPGWNEKRFELIRSNGISALQKAQEEPGVRASEATGKLLFGDHPYGHNSDGSIESLGRISLSELKELYTAQVKPEGAVLAVSGDITMDELLTLTGPALKRWRGAPQSGLFDIATAPEVHGRSIDIAMPTTQTLSQLVRLGPSRKAADFFPTFVLNHLLGGGGFGSRLMEEVREKRGLVYGVYSYFIPLAAPGPFVITLQTRADQAAEAEAVVRDVLKSLFDGKVGQKVLNDAKANLIGGFAQRIDSNRERVGLMAMVGFYDLPLNYLQVWTTKVESVTLADIRTATAAYLNPEEWNLIRVGPELLPKGGQ